MMHHLQKLPLARWPSAQYQLQRQRWLSISTVMPVPVSVGPTTVVNSSPHKTGRRWQQIPSGQ